jgi:hypothetical protein
MVFSLIWSARTTDPLDRLPSPWYDARAVVVPTVRHTRPFLEFNFAAGSAELSGPQRHAPTFLRKNIRNCPNLHASEFSLKFAVIALYSA